MGDYRTFIHLSRAWYGPSSLATAQYADEVMLGFHEAGGEIAMRWYVLGVPTPRLEVFNDNFRTLAQMPDLISALAERNNVDFTPDEFCRLLLYLGFRDETPVDDDKQADLGAKIQALVAEASPLARRPATRRQERTMNTYDMLTYMIERSNGQVIDAPENDPVLCQAEADGYADRADGYWIVRGHIQPGERRVVRFIFGEMKVIFGKDE